MATNKSNSNVISHSGTNRNNTVAATNENLTHGQATADNLATRTVTIVRERSRPLILKLQNPGKSILNLFGGVKKPEEAIEPMIEDLGKELVDLVSRNVNEIRDETKRARPQPGEDNYESKMKAYLELVNYVTEMVKRLTNVFTEALIEYRQLIDRLWNNLQSSQDDHEAQHHAQQFLQQSEQIFRDALKKHVEPLLKIIETKLNERPE